MTLDSRERRPPSETGAPPTPTETAARPPDHGQGSAADEPQGVIPRLGRFHTRMLCEESSIAPDVARERGYRTLRWTLNDAAATRELAGHRIPSWARKGDRGEGLLIPVYRPTGERIGVQWRPDTPPTNPRDGRRPKYVMPSGVAGRLDVHPRNARHMADPTVELWLTEGVKKADALTSRGACTVALAGVYNWRGSHGTLGDWEDVALRERSVVVCFDADALTKPDVLRAMGRLGRWLRSKRARPLYVVTPGEFAGREVKGADDFLAAGGTLDQLRAAARDQPPEPAAATDTFSDARMAEAIAADVLDGRFVWCAGIGWHAWDGRRWDPETPEERVIEAVRVYTLDRYAEAFKADSGRGETVKGWQGWLQVSRIRNGLALARGIVERSASAFDADPDLLNTPAGVADLTTGDVTPHDPELLMTKLTRGSYRPGHVSPDWQAALTALPGPEQDWLQVRLGQAATGHPTPDGVMPVLQGSGENGKSLLTTDGPVVALGDYAGMASAKLITASKGTEHSTEMADLRGRRLLLAEEMTEDRALDVGALKRVQDVGRIKARYVYRDNIEFAASHSLFMTSNYRPIVNETDHGTWRRLALVVFPYTFRKGTTHGEPVTRPEHRAGDPGLKARIRAGDDGQHDGIVTWLVEGAVRAHKEGADALAPTEAIAAATRAWRVGADRILGFWADRLTPDPNTCVLRTDLLDELNAWLTENGHRPWPAETFRTRFAEHSETRRHGVVDGRTRDPAAAGLIRRASPGWPIKPAPAQPTVWFGLRWRNAVDQQ